MPRNGSKRPVDKKESDLKLISELRLKGYTQLQIAEQVGCTQQQVCYDLKILRKRWMQAQQDNIDAHIAEQVQMYERLIEQAYRGWELSLTESESITHEQGATPKGEIDKTVTKTSQGKGNPMFLSQISTFLEKIAVLRGLPTQLKFQDANAAIAAVQHMGFEVREPGAQAEWEC